MEFAVCPSCKQSVLDDDAVDCPFCGSSMKAKPGAAKSAGPAAAVAATPAKAAVSTPARPGTPAKPAGKSKADDDSAFDFGDTLPSNAVPASIRRTKSQLWEVKCPMCETVGYVPAAAAGQAVKCANPKCLVPVFTAPKPEPVKTQAPPSPPKPKRSLMMVGGITVAVMAVGGVVAWMIAGLPASTSLKGPTPEDLELIKQMGGPAQKKTIPPSAKMASDTASPNADDVPAKTEPVAAAPSGSSTAALLKLLNDSSLQPRQNRSKPYCRRLTAEAFALTGDLLGARGQLDALAKVGAGVPFYRIMPLVEIAWQQLAQGDRVAAEKSVEEAWTAAASLPKTGRDRLETVIGLSAALVAVGRDADAKKLLQTHQTDEAAAQLAQHHRAVLAFGTYQLAEVESRQPAIAWRLPLSVGVVTELIAHDQDAAADKWASSFPSGPAQAELVSAVIEAGVWKQMLRGEPIVLDPLISKAESLAAPGNLLVLSRLGMVLQRAGQKADAEACLLKAKELAAGLATPLDLALPEDLRDLSRFEAPDADAAMFSAAALAEAAGLAARLGQRETAESLLSSALAYCRSMAPSLIDVEQRTADVKSGGITALRERLKREWKLKTENEAQVGATTLQKNLDELADAARQRIELQKELLTRAVDWDLSDFVWSYIRRGPDLADAQRADYLLFSPLPALLAEKYQAAGNAEQLEVVTSAWKQLTSNRPLPPSFASQLTTALASTAPLAANGAVEVLKQFNGKPDEVDERVMQAVCRLTAAGRDPVALKFAALLNDAVLREECYLLIAGMAGRRGETVAVEKHLADLSQATEKVALARGLIGGRVAASKLATKPAE